MAAIIASNDGQMRGIYFRYSANRSDIDGTTKFTLKKGVNTRPIGIP